MYTSTKTVSVNFFIDGIANCCRALFSCTDTTLSDNMSSIENPDESQEISVPGTGDEHEQPADRTTDASAEGEPLHWFHACAS